MSHPAWCCRVRMWSARHGVSSAASDPSARRRGVALVTVVFLENRADISAWGVLGWCQGAPQPKSSALQLIYLTALSGVPGRPRLSNTDSFTTVWGPFLHLALHPLCPFVPCKQHVRVELLAARRMIREMTGHAGLTGKTL